MMAAGLSLVLAAAAAPPAPTVSVNANELVLSNGLVTLTYQRNGTATRSGLASLQLHGLEGAPNLLGHGGSGYSSLPFPAGPAFSSPQVV